PRWPDCSQESCRGRRQLTGLSAGSGRPAKLVTRASSPPAPISAQSLPSTSTAPPWSTRLQVKLTLSPLTCRSQVGTRRHSRGCWRWAAAMWASMASSPWTLVVQELKLASSPQQRSSRRRRAAARRSVQASRYVLTSSSATTAVTASSAMPGPPRCLPDVGDLAQGDEGVGPVGVHPQVAAPAAADRHQLTVVDARAVGEGQAHPVALQLLELAALPLGHIH